MGAAVRNVAGGSKVVYDAVSPVVARLAESSSDVLTNKVIPAVEEYGGTAREEVERVGKSVQVNAACPNASASNSLSWQLPASASVCTLRCSPSNQVIKEVRERPHVYTIVWWGLLLPDWM